MKCEICESSMSDPVQALFALPAITSDCRSWTAGRSVRICEGCGVMKRTLHPLAVVDFANIYQGYRSYPEPTGRTKKILEFVNDKMPIPQCVLDIGTGTGKGLETLSDHFPEATVTGYEPHSDHHNQRPESKFDLITLFHVLEHVEDIHEMMEYVRSALTKNGRVLIQVPNNRLWPFDLVIADHIWHFTKASLLAFLDRCGFHVSYIGSDAIKKEITVLAQIGRDNYFYCPKERSDSIKWILDFKNFLDGVTQQVAVYGTGPAAAWTGNILGDRVGRYLDDDRNRFGIFNGRKVYHPVHNEMPVVAPFPDWQLPNIKAKHPNLRFL